MVSRLCICYAYGFISSGDRLNDDIRVDRLLLRRPSGRHFFIVIQRCFLGELMNVLFESVSQELDLVLDVFQLALHFVLVLFSELVGQMELASKS